MTLTAAQLQLVRSVLNGKKDHEPVTAEQRAAIRRLCETTRADIEPEKLLVAFKIALVESANEEQIPYGPERSDMLSQLVSVFIDELYNAMGSRGRFLEMRAS